jgi:hypothetical protein
MAHPLIIIGFCLLQHSTIRTMQTDEELFGNPAYRILSIRARAAQRLFRVKDQNCSLQPSTTLGGVEARCGETELKGYTARFLRRPAGRPTNLASHF